MMDAMLPLLALEWVSPQWVSGQLQALSWLPTTGWALMLTTALLASAEPLMLIVAQTFTLVLLLTRELSPWVPSSLTMPFMLLLKVLSSSLLLMTRVLSLS